MIYHPLANMNIARFDKDHMPIKSFPKSDKNNSMRPYYSTPQSRSKAV